MFANYIIIFQKMNELLASTYQVFDMRISVKKCKYFDSIYSELDLWVIIQVIKDSFVLFPWLFIIKYVLLEACINFTSFHWLMFWIKWDVIYITFKKKIILVYLLNSFVVKHYNGMLWELIITTATYEGW